MFQNIKRQSIQLCKQIYWNEKETQGNKTWNIVLTSLFDIMKISQMNIFGYLAWYLKLMKRLTYCVT